MSKYPNAPRAGQRGFLPANFDVEEHLRNTGHAEDELSRMILTAMKEYGFIIADRNLFTNAFNLEAASSYAPYARQGKNVYKEDPKLAAMFANFVPSGFTGNQFPWQQVQWMPVNYTESAENSAGRNTASADTSVKFKYPSDSYGKTGTGSGVIYQPAEHHATVYAGETAVRRAFTSRTRFPRTTVTRATTTSRKSSRPRTSAPAAGSTRRRSTLLAASSPARRPASVLPPTARPAPTRLI